MCVSKLYDAVNEKFHPGVGLIDPEKLRSCVMRGSNSLFYLFNAP